MPKKFKRRKQNRGDTNGVVPPSPDLRIGVSAEEKGNTVTLHFNTPVMQIGMEVATARALAKQILERADDAEGGRIILP